MPNTLASATGWWNQATVPKLKRLTLTGFRCFQQAQFEFQAGLNVISGPNASGKTALIEALWLLASGRSFRTVQLGQLIYHNAESSTVFAQVDGHRLGWCRQADKTQLRLDGETARVQSVLSACFPAQLMTPEAHRLLEEGPAGRRRYLDWGGFYQSREFIHHWRSLRQALKQRNAALRSGQPRDLVTLWDAALIQACEQIDALRKAYVAQLQALLPGFVSALLPDYAADALQLLYQPGWRKELSYAEALAESWQRDSRYGRTHVGAHRADVRFKLHGRDVETVLSRGQQKLFVAALLLAQAQLLKQHTGQVSVMLMDDLPAELDEAHRARLLALLQKLGVQHLVTTTDIALIPGGAQANQVVL